MFYLSIYLQRGQGDWTLQEADRTDQRTGHCAVSSKQHQRSMLLLFLFTLVVEAAVTFWACAISAESRTFFFIIISPVKAKLWDQIGFLASVYLPKLSIKSDFICGEAGLSQESEFWMQSYEYYL